MSADGPLPPWLAPLTVPCSWMYRAAVDRRNRRFDHGVGVQRISLPVISVGNITTGGTGKSPMVAWTARLLTQEGLSPVIAMRGYKARRGEASDEQAEYHDLLPATPVLADPDRARALREFLPRRADVRCVVLDDGFQHRQLHRDLDLVLVDATAATFEDRLLPAGHLREPLASLARAHEVVITKASESNHARLEALKEQVFEHHGKSSIAVVSQRWESLSRFGPEGSLMPEPIEWLRGKRLLVMLGVGNPTAVVDQATSQGANVEVSIPCRDHDRFSQAKLRMARRRCRGLDAMLVTGKDWVKLRGRPEIRDWPAPIVVPRLAIGFIEGESALRGRVLDAAGGMPGAGGAAR